DVISGMSGFSLPDRRFQVLYRRGNILIVDDYAHHPTEIRATLDTLQHENFGRVITVFQPHRYTRLENLMEEFSDSFKGSDIVVLAKLYSANQEEIKGVNSQVLAEMIRKKGSDNVINIDDNDRLLSYLKDEIREGDAVIFLSAGDLTRSAHHFSEMMEKEKI
ncbi:MAG: UDP-N-acetylmuramate--L-alanine ligase, partial [Candidatus Aminicenantes bacterium]|nr:UDP-N-acetylmuramate--L-alanine ligase [Candidatus Aminicenantes bacterium]